MILYINHYYSLANPYSLQGTSIIVNCTNNVFAVIIVNSNEFCKYVYPKYSFLGYQFQTLLFLCTYFVWLFNTSFYYTACKCNTENIPLFKDKHCTPHWYFVQGCYLWHFLTWIKIKFNWSRLYVSKLNFNILRMFKNWSFEKGEKNVVWFWFIPSVYVRALCF